MVRRIALPVRGLLPVVLLAACVGLALPTRGEAQIGGFLKKKLRDRVTHSGGDAKVGADGSGAPHFGEDVLEMTPAVLDRLAAALASEKAALDAFARERAAVKSPEEYEQCTAQTTVSPEAQKLLEDAGDDATKIAAVGERLRAMVLEKCGADPSDFNENRVTQARLDAVAKGRAAGGFTTRQLEILEERVLPFCAAGGTQQRIPGSGKDIFYVYSDGEMKALQQRCDALSAGIRAVE